MRQLLHRASGLCVVNSCKHCQRQSKELSFAQCRWGEHNLGGYRNVQPVPQKRPHHPTNLPAPGHILLRSPPRQEHFILPQTMGKASGTPPHNLLSIKCLSPHRPCLVHCNCNRRCCGCVRSRFGLCQGPTTRHSSDLSLVAKIGVLLLRFGLRRLLSFSRSLQSSATQ